MSEIDLNKIYLNPYFDLTLDEDQPTNQPENAMSKITYKVFNEKEEDKKEVYFKLIEGEERIRLVACDENGKILPGGHILSISKNNGEGFLNASISKNLGFSLDKEGKLKFENQ